MNRETHEAWAYERVDAYLDGDLSVHDRARFAAALEQSDALRAEVEMARRVQAALRALPQWDAPAAVLEAARHDAVLAASPPVRRHRPLWPWTTALVAAAAILLAVAILRDVNAPGVLPPVNEPPIVAVDATARPSVAELASAREQVMMTFAYLGAVQRHGAAKAGAALLDDGLTPPLRTAIDALNLTLDPQQPPVTAGKELTS